MAAGEWAVLPDPVGRGFAGVEGATGGDEEELLATVRAELAAQYAGSGVAVTSEELEEDARRELERRRCVAARRELFPTWSSGSDPDWVAPSEWLPSRAETYDLFAAEFWDKKQAVHALALAQGGFADSAHHSALGLAALAQGSATPDDAATHDVARAWPPVLPARALTTTRAEPVGGGASLLAGGAAGTAGLDPRFADRAREPETRGRGRGRGRRGRPRRYA